MKSNKAFIIFIKVLTNLNIAIIKIFIKNKIYNKIIKQNSNKTYNKNNIYIKLIKVLILYLFNIILYQLYTIYIQDSYILYY